MSKEEDGRESKNVLTTGFAHSGAVINNLMIRELAFFFLEETDTHEGSYFILHGDSLFVSSLGGE